MYNTSAAIEWHEWNRISNQKIKTSRAQGHHQKEQYGRVISGHPVLQLQVDI